MNRTKPDLSSNRIHNRRIYGGPRERYTNSGISNLMMGQTNGFLNVRVDSLVGANVNERKLMPTIADEHIWLGSANGVAVSDGSTISHSYPYTLIHNRPQTWAVGKSIVFTLYYRDVRTDGIIKDWAAMSTLTDAFNDMCSIDITLELI